MLTQAILSHQDFWIDYKQQQINPNPNNKNYGKSTAFFFLKSQKKKNVTTKSIKPLEGVFPPVFAAGQAKMTPSTTQPQWMLSHTKRLRLKSWNPNGPKKRRVFQREVFSVNKWWISYRELSGFLPAKLHKTAMYQRFHLNIHGKFNSQKNFGYFL